MVFPEGVEDILRRLDRDDLYLPVAATQAMDLSYLRDWATALGVTDDLAELLAEPT